MICFLERCRYALVGIALMTAGHAFGQEKEEAPLWTRRHLFSGEVPLPGRIVRSDLVVTGRVVALEPEDVEAGVSSGKKTYMVDYRVAVVKVDEVIQGKKEMKEFHLGFISPDQDKKVDKKGNAMPVLSPVDFVSVKVGQDGLFFLKKHSQGDFYVNPMLFGGFLPRDNSPEFAKNLENVRGLSKVLELPLESLKSENASNRYIAAVMLIDRYRPNGATPSELPETEVDAEESKALLKILLEANWQDVNEAIGTTIYPPHPYRIFLQLGVTKKNGYEPPINAPDFRETLAYTQRWLRDKQDKYRIQRVGGPK